MTKSTHIQRNLDSVAELVSVILPVYNSANYLGETIKSVVDQTYHNLEILIVDDCSTDGSHKILQEHKEKEKRITLIRNKENRGVIQSRNLALRMAKGRYVAFIDSDDIWHERKIEIQLASMVNLDASFSFTSYRQISQKGNKYSVLINGPSTLSWKTLHLTRFIALSSVVIDRMRTGQLEFDESNNLNFGEDFLLWASLLKDSSNAIRVKGDLLKYRLVTGSLSSSKLANLRKVWKIHREWEKLSFILSFTFFLSYIVFSIYKKLIYYPYFKNNLRSRPSKT